MEKCRSDPQLEVRIQSCMALTSNQSWMEIHQPWTIHGFEKSPTWPISPIFPII
jgi:hypothetical protein